MWQAEHRHQLQAWQNMTEVSAATTLLQTSHNPFECAEYTSKPWPLGQTIVGTRARSSGVLSLVNCASWPPASDSNDDHLLIDWGVAVDTSPPAELFPPLISVDVCGSSTSLCSTASAAALGSPELGSRKTADRQACADKSASTSLSAAATTSLGSGNAMRCRGIYVRVWSKRLFCRRSDETLRFAGAGLASRVVISGVLAPPRRGVDDCRWGVPLRWGVAALVPLAELAGPPPPRTGRAVPGPASKARLLAWSCMLRPGTVALVTGSQARGPPAPASSVIML